VDGACRRFAGSVLSDAAFEKDFRGRGDARRINWSVGLMDYRSNEFRRQWTKLCRWVLLVFSTPTISQIDFARVENAYEWKFPRDHGQHSAYQTEWWYFTGNLRTAAGRRFGYELTFFRQALAPAILLRPSPWAVRDAYIAHFAVTDVEKEKFHYDQKIARGTLNLAGANATALDVHLGDWFARRKISSPNDTGAGEIQLRAASAFGEINFILKTLQPPVFHGERGLLPNSSLPGDAAYYYSLVSLQTEGALKIGDESFRLHGLSWMDHEFFTPVANPEIIGWDWLSLHLSDSTAVMLANLRLANGANSSYSTGTFIQRDEPTQALTQRDFTLVPQGWWTSPLSGGKYPVAWKIEFLDYELRLSTPVKNQELDTRRTTGKVYWEGCVAALGKKRVRDIRGEGYLEMTGYAKPSADFISQTKK
jgi:predicted secreted hydrolase